MGFGSVSGRTIIIWDHVNFVRIFFSKKLTSFTGNFLGEELSIFRGDRNRGNTVLRNEKNCGTAKVQQKATDIPSITKTTQNASRGLFVKETLFPLPTHFNYPIGLQSNICLGLPCLVAPKENNKSHYTVGDVSGTPYGRELLLFSRQPTAQFPHYRYRGHTSLIVFEKTLYMALEQSSGTDR